MGGADEEDAGAGGRADEEANEPPYTGPAVVELRLDRQHSCARLEDATVHCWGKDVIVYPDPSGGFSEMGIVTWPDGPYASSGPEPPQVDFTQVSYGNEFGCGLRSDETLECWGANDFGQATPPAGAYELIAAGAAHACAFGNARGVVCWGKDDAFQASPPSAISAKNHGYVRVVTGGSGVRYGGVWMETEEEGGGSGWDPFPGSASACGLRADGRLDCFGAATAVPTPRKKFRDVSAADQWVCGATAEGVECWGSGIERATVSGDFVQVSTAHDVTCALDAKKRIHCWAPLPGGTKTDVPSGTFERVVAAGTNDEGSPRAVFALRADGSLVIFRPDDSGAIAGQTELPGPFVNLAVGPEEGSRSQRARGPSPAFSSGSGNTATFSRAVARLAGALGATSSTSSISTASIRARSSTSRWATTTPAACSLTAAASSVGAHTCADRLARRRRRDQVSKVA
jgi:hypothetical protein